MISRVLVANRGEIARRVFSTCRRLGIGTVAVYTDPDADAPHVTEADFRVRLDGRNGYLDSAQLIAAARPARAPRGPPTADPNRNGRRTSPLPASSIPRTGRAPSRSS